MTTWKYWPAAGLSPRLRGNPRYGYGPRNSHMVYPRACGGTPMTLVASATVMGLSPRLRGNPPERGRAGGPPRSIPAPAGEPVADKSFQWRYEVYPRACGGTISATPGMRPMVGLSPRLRGNHRPGPDRERHGRSIPAPAGEPRAADWTIS